MIISILIPVYNVEQYIERCINSVIKQSILNKIECECIIINDQTKDNSIEIAKKIISQYTGKLKFKIIEHSKNRGLAAARNTAVSYAKGKYLIHIDSDDYCEPTLLEELYNVAEKYNAEITGCDFYIDLKEKKIINTYKNSGFNSQECFDDTISGKYPSSIWRKLIRKDLYVKNNLKEIEGINNGEDYIISIKLHYYAKNVAYVHKPLYNYIKYNNTSIISSIKKEYVIQHIEACKEIERFLKENKLFEKYKIAFYERCFIAKRPLILIPKLQDITKWKTTFPESNKYIHYYKLSLKNKIAWIIISKIPQLGGAIIKFFKK